MEGVAAQRVSQARQMGLQMRLVVRFQVYAVVDGFVVVKTTTQVAIVVKVGVVAIVLVD